MKLEELIKSRSFMKFVNREFNKTAKHATIEEMAVFAFGDIKEALKEFKKYKYGE